MDGAPSTFGTLDAARALSGLDAKLAPSVAATFGALATANLGEFNAVHNAVKAFQLDVGPIVAPQIAEALGAIHVGPMASSFAEALTGIDRASTLQFAKIVEEVDFGKMMQPRFDELFRGLSLSIGTAAMDALPRADLTPGVARATEDALALAEVSDVASIVDEAVGRFESLSPGKRRALALDVAFLAAACLSAYVSLAAANKATGAGSLLAVAATLIRIYWRLIGKVD